MNWERQYTWLHDSAGILDEKMIHPLAIRSSGKVTKFCSICASEYRYLIMENFSGIVMGKGQGLPARGKGQLELAFDYQLSHSPPPGALGRTAPALHPARRCW